MQKLFFSIHVLKTISNYFAEGGRAKLLRPIQAKRIKMKKPTSSGEIQWLIDLKEGEEKDCVDFLQPCFVEKKEGLMAVIQVVSDGTTATARLKTAYRPHAKHGRVFLP